jgi:hypothetical protein
MYGCSLESLAEIAPQGAKCEVGQDLRSHNGSRLEHFFGWLHNAWHFFGLILVFRDGTTGPGNRLGSFDWNCSRAGPLRALLNELIKSLDLGDPNFVWPPGWFPVSCCEISTKPKAGNIWLADPNTSDKGNEQFGKQLTCWFYFVILTEADACSKLQYSLTTIL